MSQADQIGLVFPFGLVADHSLWVTFAILCAIAPGMHFALAGLLESRFPPISPQKQFLGFLPGMLFLNAAVAAMLQVPLKDGVAKTGDNQWVIAALVVLLTIGLVGQEISSGLHPLREILSPVGLYHSGFGGYGCYTYVILSIAAAVLTSADWSDSSARLWTGAALIFAAIFLLYVKNDGERDFDSSETYIEGWNPIWRRRR